MGNSINKTKVCAIRVLVNACKVLFPRKRLADRPSGRFLIISTTGIGDTLWGTPAINALRRAYPEGYIGVLTNTVGAEILKGNRAINEIFIFKRGASGLLRLPFLLRTLRKRRFEKAFIFHASDRIVWPISFMTGAPEITGFKGQGKNMDFILTKILEADPAAHGVRNRFLMLAEAGVAEKDETLELYLSEKDEEDARAFLEGNGIAGEELLIGIHPGAQKPFKCWPAKNFVETGNILSAKYKCRIVITGNSDEKALAEEVAVAINGAVSAAGRLSIRCTAALIGKMSLFITNDTGPMHIAYALKTPTIALFSPTDPGLCGPYRAENAVVIQKPITCTPCIGKKCCNPVCLGQIAPHEVIEAAERILAMRVQR